MGWKNVKEHYRIGHYVSVYPEKGICIGSGYIHDLIVIGLDGVIKKRDDGRHNADLKRYLSEFDADPEQLKRLVLLPDSFTADLTVYCCEDGEILEKKCEAFGWPNICHDGLMQYDNTFSADKNEVVAWAKRDMAIALRWNSEQQAEARKKLKELESERSECLAKQAKLDAAYPDVPAEKSRYDRED